MTPSHSPTMYEPDEAYNDSGFEGQAEQGVGPSAMVLKGCDGALDGPEGIEVGGLGRERHGHRGVGGLAIETGAGEDGSGHEVGQGVHGVPAYRGRRCTW